MLFNVGNQGEALVQNNQSKGFVVLLSSVGVKWMDLVQEQFYM
jgi:hypothetical protein